MTTRPESVAPDALAEVRRPDPLKAAVRNSDHAEDPVRKSDREAAERLAAELFARALEAAHIERDEAAFLMGVTRSMVDKMCAPTEAKAPSLVQLVLLGPAFHVALIQQLDHHFGLGRALLARVQQTLGTLGLLLR